MTQKQYQQPVEVSGLSNSDWEELEALSFEPFEFERGPLTRGQWLALADMAVGKASRIDAGWYGDEHGDGRWASQLRQISATIIAATYN